jgi:hypothetical protein
MLQLTAPVVNVPSTQCSCCWEDVPKPAISFPCGHTYCTDCLKLQTEVACGYQASKFPLLCAHENCNEPIDLSIIRQHLSGHELEKLLKLSFASSHKSDKYWACRGVDCDFVYLSDPLRIVTCPGCLTQTCTECQDEPHIGIPCADNADKEKKEKYQLEAYCAMTGTKACPNCRTLIEKVGEPCASNSSALTSFLDRRLQPHEMR